MLTASNEGGEWTMVLLLQIKVGTTFGATREDKRF